MIDEVIEQRLKAVEKNVWEAVKNSRETFYAAVFNNTISGSSWLKDTSFSPAGWAAGYQYLYVLYRILNEKHPKSILDLGLGQTTKMIAQYAAANPEVEHIIVESNQDWIDFYLNANTLPSNSRIIKLDYMMKKMPGCKDPVRHYKFFKRAMKGKVFDLISIDAPFGGDMKEVSRVDVLGIIPNGIASSYAILLDDTNRPQEQAMIPLLLNALIKNGFTASSARYSARNKCDIVVSDDNLYLKTL